MGRMGLGRIGMWVSLAAVVVVIIAIAAAQSASATLTVATRPSPLGLGQNHFSVTVADTKGQPVTDAEVALRLVMPADPKTKHPEMRTEGTLAHAGGGVYQGIALVTMAGDWDVTVTARRSGKVIGETTARLTAHLTRPPQAPAASETRTR